MAKQCSHCGQVRELGSFYKRPKRPDLQPVCKPCFRTKQLMQRYGITQAEHDQMKSAQGDKCALCIKPFNGKAPHVDHDHASGITRRLLCSRCNTALGLVKENIETLSNMIMYLNFYSVSAASNTDEAPQVLEKVG